MGAGRGAPQSHRRSSGAEYEYAHASAEALEAAGFVTRTRGTVDSRQVILCLTPQAKALREEAEDIPSLFSCKLRDAGCAEGELSALREQLDHLIPLLETVTQSAGV